MKTVLTAVALILASSQVLSATIACPASIKTTQSLQQPIHGWDGFLDDLNAVHTFNRISFYADHPKEHASLSPDSERSKNHTLTWTFGKETIWLACEYSNTLMQLTKPLPTGTKQCRVTYNANYSQVIKIECS